MVKGTLLTERPGTCCKKHGTSQYISHLGLILFRMGAGSQKGPSTSFFPVTTTSVGISSKSFYWSNPYKIEVMIISFIEMLQLPNFGHMTTYTV